jgi:hypothetical protein
MKLTITRNYQLEAMFLKKKNGDRWGKIQRSAQWIPGTEVLDWHPLSNYVGSKWGLLDSMKLRIKWSYEQTWNFLLIKIRSDGELSCDICTEIIDLNLLPNIQHFTQVVSSIRVTYFYEINPTSALGPNECYSYWCMMLGKEVSCEIYKQL